MTKPIAGPRLPPIPPDIRTPVPGRIVRCVHCDGTLWETEDDGDIRCRACSRVDARYHGPREKPRIRDSAPAVFEDDDDEPLVDVVKPPYVRPVPPTEADLRCLYLDEGLSVQRISVELGKAPSTIDHWLRHYGLLKRREKPAVDQPDVEVLRRMWVEEKLSAAEIGKRLGRPASTVADWLRRYGLVEQRERHKGGLHGTSPFRTVGRTLGVHMLAREG